MGTLGHISIVAGSILMLVQIVLSIIAALTERLKAEALLTAAEAAKLKDLEGDADDGKKPWWESFLGSINEISKAAPFLGAGLLLYVLAAALIGGQLVSVTATVGG